MLTFRVALAGHVLTRIVYKGAYGLGVLHDYEDECMVLRALLGQKVWRRGKRGRVPLHAFSTQVPADTPDHFSIRLLLGHGTNDWRSSS